MTTPDQSVSKLRDSFRAGITRPLSWRVDQLKGIEALLVEHADDIEQALAQDLGRPRTESFLAEVYQVLSEVRSIRRGLRRWSKDERTATPLVLRPARARVAREPIGVALVIGPWNYPINLVLAPLAAAVAAGNCVIAKPSELAPASSSLLARLLPRYLDERAIVVVEGDATTAEQLIDAPVDYIFFTGGTRIGRLVGERAARHLTPVTLELGGKSPAIVAEGADLKVAARRIVWGKMLNAGQSCVAPDYVLAAAPIAASLCDEVISCLRAFYGEDPKASGDFGRIVNTAHTERLSRLLRDHGGEVIFGGEVDSQERYVAPTVVRDPDPHSALMSEEIFGPILPILAVEDLDAASTFVASRPSPLAIYVFSNDRDAIARVQASTRSGAICVNTTVHQFASKDLPFGGIGESGFGRYHGRYGYETFSHLRPIFDKPTRPDLPLTYPPYGGARDALVRWALMPSRPFRRR
jgi:aldehyde dehydrogenase (NAD+)